MRIENYVERASGPRINQNQNNSSNLSDEVFTRDYSSEEDNSNDLRSSLVVDSMIDSKKTQNGNINKSDRVTQKNTA